jgi:hypothetical protein
MPTDAQVWTAIYSLVAAAILIPTVIFIFLRRG